jgi:hypothetical protein
MFRRAATAVCCAVLAGMCVVPTARAQRTSSLSWVRLRGTEACISTQALAERVEERVGHAVFVSASQADLSLEGHVERSAKPSAFVATLVVSDRSGHVLGRRVLRAPGDDCDALTPSLVLVIAIAIDPRAALPAGGATDLSPEAKSMLQQLGLPELSDERIRAELGVPEPAAPQTTAPVPAAQAPTPPPADRPLPAPPPPDPSRIEFSVRLSGELGVLPQPSLGLALGPTFVTSERFAIDAWLTALLPRSTDVTGASGAARFTLIGAGAAACARFGGVRRFDLRACAGMRGGVLLGQGRDFDRDHGASSAWLEPTLYAAPVFRRGRWLLTARAGAGVPLVRDEFRYQDGANRFHALYRPSALVARVELGAGVVF